MAGSTNHHCPKGKREGKACPLRGTTSGNKKYCLEHQTKCSVCDGGLPFLKTEGCPACRTKRNMEAKAKADAERAKKDEEREAKNKEAQDIKNKKGKGQGNKGGGK